MQFEEGFVASQLPVVDESVGLDLTSEGGLKFSYGNLGLCMEMHGGLYNPWTCVYLNGVDQRTLLVTTNTSGRIRTVWRWDGTNSDVAQTIWNTLTGGGRDSLPLPNRKQSPYLLFVSQHRSRISIKARRASNESALHFARVGPDDGDERLALLPALEQAKMLLAASATNGVFEISLGMAYNSSYHRSVYPYWQWVEPGDDYRNRRVKFEGLNVSVYFPGNFAYGETWLGTLPEGTNIAAIQRGTWCITSIASDTVHQVRTHDQTWIYEPTHLTYVCSGVEIVLVSWNKLNGFAR